MGGAEEEKLGFGAAAQVLQVIEVQLIAPVGAAEGIGQEGPSAVFGDALEGGIGRGLGDNGIPGLGKGVNGLPGGVDHAKAAHQPAGIHGPAVAALHPADEGRAEGLVHTGIAVDAEVSGLPDGGDDLRGHQQVHIGHREGNHVGIGDTGPLHRDPFGSPHMESGAQGGKVIGGHGKQTSSSLFLHKGKGRPSGRP